MNAEDFRLLSEFGKALYSSPEQARARSLETVAALTSRDSYQKSDSNGLVRAVRILLYRAEKEGISATSSGLNQPFYRLTSLERLALMALHSGRISYLKLSQILGISIDEVEKLLWHSRMKMANQIETRLSVPHPPGTQKEKHACPELYQDHPWTQKLLDDEMKSFELTYVQNHILVCASCSRALTTTRQFYYGLEKWIPKLSSDEGFDEQMLGLRRAQIEAGIIPSDLSIREGLRAFFSRTEIRISVYLLAILGVAQLYLYLH